MSLRLESRILRGEIGSKGIECVLRSTGGIPAGEYMLLPAVQDPVYGTLVQLVPVPANPRRPERAHIDKATPILMSAAAGKVYSPASMKFDTNSPATLAADTFTPRGRAGALILSAKALPARNGIVVDRGFSDLVEALRNGPLAVTVS
jgi:hypothetical protein